MSTAIRRRVERLERQVGLELDHPLVVLVEPGETRDVAIERCCAGWAAPGSLFYAVGA
jgi:hypothetical protein